MLGRTLLQLSVCALLCACGGNYPKKPKACAADGGCDCSAESCADAATSSDAGEVTPPQGGSVASTRTRSSAMRVATDAGARDAGATEQEAPSKERDSGAAAESGKKSAAKSAQGGSGGAAGAEMKPAKKMEPSHSGTEHDQGGSRAEASADATACEASCGPCQACDEQKTCQPVTGRDDADSCNDTRSCSSRGACLQVSEAQADLGSKQDYAELTASYAQVLTFVEPATIQEIRLEVSCNENDESFPAVWIAAAPGGIPSDNIIATANVLYQPPSDTNTFALLELSKTLEEPATGPIAIVVSKSEMSCIVRLNKESPYPNGNLFTQTGPLWTPAEGSMVFQVLSSQ